MTTTPEEPLNDDDMTTAPAGDPQAGLGGGDADGTDGDATDTTDGDADGADGDATDTTDGDASDGDATAPTPTAPTRTARTRTAPTGTPPTRPTGTRPERARPAQRRRPDLPREGLGVARAPASRRPRRPGRPALARRRRPAAHLQSAIRTPSIRLAQDGAVLPESSYTRSATLAGKPLTGLVDARKALALFDDGATDRASRACTATGRR